MVKIGRFQRQEGFRAPPHTQSDLRPVSRKKNATSALSSTNDAQSQHDMNDSAPRKAEGCMHPRSTARLASGQPSLVIRIE